jgi:NAD-dependent dihydropyrimidine dehydrogenase PreA subunit
MARKAADLSAGDRERYENFQKWINTSWYSQPITDNSIMIIALRYTPEEAEWLTGFPLTPKSFEELEGFKGTPDAELRKKIDDFTRRGMFFSFTKNNRRYYLLHEIYSSVRMWGWPGPSATPANKELADLLESWMSQFMTPWGDASEKGLRTIPIQQTVEDDRQLLPYEDVKKVLDSYSYFCVTQCGCRWRKNLSDLTPNCKHPTENCLHFDRLAHYAVENGFGKEITRQEAEAILRDSAERGLVFGINNQQMGSDTICSCCSCCCMWFDGMRSLKKAGAGTMSPSNYRIRTDDETCTGCGLCVKRCPMDALQLKDTPAAKGRKTTLKDETGKEKTLTNKTGKLAVADADLCIGCGVCAYKCPSKSLILVRNETEHHPPRTGRDWVIQYVTDTAAYRTGDKA